MVGMPKSPADRNPKLRELARGEQCTVGLPGCTCHPDTTVWAHTNTLSDQKGMGYKGHDSQGFFAGHCCHAMIDQPSGRSGLSEEEKKHYVKLAQTKTTLRLMDISNSPTMKPWKVATARWALERRAT